MAQPGRRSASTISGSSSASARSLLARRRAGGLHAAELLDGGEQGQTSLWLLSTFGGGPRRLTRCGEKDGQPAWSPTGERIAFLIGANSMREGRDASSST